MQNYVNPDYKSGPLPNDTMREVVTQPTFSSTHDLSNYLQSIQQHLFTQPLTKTALVYNEQSIAYSVVAKKVYQAMLALEHMQLKSGAVVAIYLHKSPEYIYSVLACAFKGLIWLPIDIDSPLSRREYLLDNSQVDLVISDQPIENYAYVLSMQIYAEQNANPVMLPELFRYSVNREAAYYLYTSGSTGTPKCVVLNNQATAHVITQSIAQWQMTANDVIMAVTPFHHDMSVFDLFATLALGAALVLPTPEQSKNAVAWAHLVQQHHITVWISVPAIVDMLCSVARPEQLQSLRLIAQGGDYIKPHLIEKIRMLIPHVRLFSLGGPTETTIWSIWHDISPEDQDVIPYGQALKGNQYLILNENMQRCAVGEVGRMYMVGINLSNGYLVNGQIDLKDFVAIDRLETEAKDTAAKETALAFRMSDLGYERADGTLIFAGRDEGYLKIKGVRISAAEVEAALVKHTVLREVVAVCCTHPHTQTAELVAIFSQQGLPNDLNVQHLKVELQQHLPHSYIPTKWYGIDHLPLTQNAKIDRKRLQKMAQEQLYPKVVNSQQSAESITDTIITIFRDFLAEHNMSPSSIFCQSEILRLGIRTKQLKSIAEKINQKYAVSLDIYTLASCKTVQDVVNCVQSKTATAAIQS